MSARLNEYIELASTLRGRSATIDETLAALRRQGASQMDCLKALRVVEGLTIGEAKELVDLSPAWSDRLQANRRLRKLAMRAAAQDATSVEISAEEVKCTFDLKRENNGHER